jgi:GYF domain 2
MLDKSSLSLHHTKAMTFHVARGGEITGEFNESTFQEKVFAGEIRPEDHYWTEGFADWRLVSQYRITAKTVRMSAVPPATWAETGRFDPTTSAASTRRMPLETRRAGSRAVAAGATMCIIGTIVAVIGAATSVEMIGVPGVVLLAIGLIVGVFGRLHG